MSQMTRHILLITLALISGFVGVNLLVGVWGQSWRLDLTEDQLYRLSPGAKAILSDINEPIDVEFYYSRADAAQFPAIRAYGARVRGLLRTLEAEAGDKIRLREIDPKPFSAEEDTAIAAGLTQIPGEGGTALFFGLRATNSVDDERVLTMFDPEDEARLEYNILRLIAELDRAYRPRIGLITSLPLNPLNQDNPHPFIDELQRAYQIEWIERDFQQLPERLDLLAILHPGNLSDHQLYLIDQFALNQGRLMVAIDPMAHYALKPGPDGLPPIDAQRSSDLGPLLARWGVRFDPTRVAMDRANGLPVQVVEADGRPRTREYPLWFTIPQSGLDADDPSTANLNRGLNVGSPGLLTGLDTTQTQFSPLAITSAEAALLDVDIVITSPGPEEVAGHYETLEQSQYTLAGRISGVVTTAFPDGPPTENSDALFAGPHRETSSGPIDVIVMADIDWLDTNFFLDGQGHPVADNMTLALNWMDSLAGDRALLRLRSRTSSMRPMERVETLRREAEDRYLELQDEFTRQLLEAEAELQALRESGRASGLTRTSPDDAQTAEALRDVILESRARLRDIERGFFRDIDALERDLLIWTLWVPAGSVLVLGFLVFLIRRRRRA